MALEAIEHVTGASASGPACDQGFREVPWNEEVRVRKRAGDTVLQTLDLDLVAGAARSSDPPDKNDDLETADGTVRIPPWLPPLDRPLAVDICGWTMCFTAH